MSRTKRPPTASKPREAASGGAVIDAYLAKVPPEHRAVIERLRRTIRAAAPRAVEALSYGVPSVRQDGRGVVAYAAPDDHLDPGVRRGRTDQRQDGLLDVGEGNFPGQQDKWARMLVGEGDQQLEEIVGVHVGGWAENDAGGR